MMSLFSFGITLENILHAFMYVWNEETPCIWLQPPSIWCIAYKFCDFGSTNLFLPSLFIAGDISTRFGLLNHIVVNHSFNKSHKIDYWGIYTSISFYVHNIPVIFYPPSAI